MRTRIHQFLSRIVAASAFAAILPAAIPTASRAAEVDLKSIQPAESTKKKKGGGYVGVFGGSSLSQESRLAVDDGTRTLRYDTGEEEGNLVFGIEVGYSWRTKYLLEFALEFEAFYMNSELRGALANKGNESVAVSPSDLATVAADLQSAVFMLNGIITLDLRKLQPRLGKFITRLRPYVGGGIGGAQLWYRNQTYVTVGDAIGTPTAPSSSPFSVDEFVFAYQFFGGLEVRLTDKLNLYTEYRRLTFEKTEDLSELTTQMILGGLHLRY